jgi:DNA-binding CsgD family transcriptional regulator
MARRRRDVNPIDVIEAAYDLEPSDEDWLRTLATIVRPLLDGQRGLLAYFFDATQPIPHFQRNAVMLDITARTQRHGMDVVAAVPDLAQYVHFNNEGLLGLLECGRRAGFGDLRERGAIASFFRKERITDMVALQTIEPGGKGLVFAAGQAEPRVFDARTRRLWARVNTHIATGRRLRAAVQSHASAEEAVLLPSGKLEHAEGDGKARTAREALRDAVQRTEKARGKQRKSNPVEATEAWTALVAGRWSLVDRFERDGRRYVVARRNEHALPDPRALTPRERTIAHLAALGKSNKLIGYELGLSVSTIGSHLSTVMRKLGAKSRIGLIHLITHLRAE